MSLVHLLLSESKKVLKTKQNPKRRDYVKGLQWQKLEGFEQQISKIALDYNPKYKINIDDAILIEIIN